jgi:hypothetical protein
MGLEPVGESLRKATKWISAHRLENPAAKLPGLIERACVKFDLSPTDAEFLMRFFSEEKAHGQAMEK